MGEAGAGEAAPRPAKPSPYRDLLPRALSAAVLAVVAVAATAGGAVPFTLLVLVVGVLMSWEWSRIVRGRGLDVCFGVQAAAVVAGVVLAARGAAFAGVLVMLAASIAVLALAPRDHARLSGVGVAYVGLPAIALIWLRGSSETGAIAILFLFTIVWTTDTFAYLCGRLIGGPKLWPALSPGKTWSGTLGGLVCAALAGGLFALALPSQTPLALALVASLLSVVSQMGDLAESALKRAFAVKNASELIPGHGGFMDRMDGVVVAAVAAAIIAAMRGGAVPAEALLYW